MKKKENGRGGRKHTSLLLMYIFRKEDSYVKKTLNIKIFQINCEYEKWGSNTWIFLNNVS